MRTRDQVCTRTSLIWLAFALTAAACEIPVSVRVRCEIDDQCPAGHGCASGTCARCPECAAGKECFHGECVGPSCGDLERNGSETDVDCGGGTCPACADGKACLVDSDCLSGSCDPSLACATRPEPCANGSADGAETDVDCGGGTCPTCADGKACLVDGDCRSGLCGPSLRCLAPTGCDDGVQDGQESDVDCGGAACPSCPLGAVCSSDGDCVTGTHCGASRLCLAWPSTCSNGSKDGTETDIDCGGPDCQRCAEGASCAVALDCLTLDCSSAHVCVPWASCANHAQDGQETDVDCGGDSCPACALGAACRVAGDCASGLCGASRICASPPSCSNGSKDGQETAVDCGGTACPACADGKSCASGHDCLSRDCRSGTCVARPPCDNRVRDGQETDVDCGGGTCPDCGRGRTCSVGADCASNNCGPSMTCDWAPSCSNGTRDGQETDVDCGGPCPRCADGASCSDRDDCFSGRCSSGRCQADPPCANHARDGQETDVDCGGGLCAPCSLGGACLVEGDCSTGLCGPVLTCARPSSCSNGSRDGLETDVDCGGAACRGCLDGASCAADADCLSRRCSVAGTCDPRPACDNRVRDGLETDVDCGGGVCPRCGEGQSCASGGDCSDGVCDPAHTCLDD